MKWKARILPHSPAPVILLDKGKYQIKMFNFALIPVWSKERRPKFSTHNVRLETVLEKPTWKRPFLKNHCLVPISTFIEPIYIGKFAGNMVKFELAECAFVPAVFDHWTDKETDKTINSFSILTSDPGKFVNKIGHERSPIFIKQSKEIFDFWFDVENHSGDEFIKLLSKQHEPKMKAIIDRPMKPGWEKRA